jgi:hypothetical protein
VLLRHGDLSVVAFWPDKAILSRPRKHVPPRSLLDTMLRIRARTLSSIAVPLQAAAATWPGSRSGAVDST